MDLWASSTRHMRVLQFAGVSQHDWHDDQMSLRPQTRTVSSTMEITHCVLADFDAATQSTNETGPFADDDFSAALDTLIDAGTAGEPCISLM